MKKVLMMLLVALPLMTMAQKFYVDTDIKNCKEEISNKLHQLGYLTTDKAAANYTVTPVFAKQHKYLTLKVKNQYLGYIQIENKDSVIAKSEKKGASSGALNGFSPKLTIVKKVLNDDFAIMIKEINNKQ